MRWAVLLTLLAATSTGCTFFRQAQSQLPEWFQLAETLDGRQFPLQRVFWSGFRNPDAPDATGLYLLEPYQPGKVPLVFIHGLVSDPLTWQTAIENLRQDPQIAHQYQFWVFRYPTGNSYLKAAADLRRELYSARERFDAQQTDFAFDQMVLVGHSMGGLVAKLQVTDSNDTIWRAVSDQPLESLELTDKARADIAEAVRFNAIPFVRQVIFIATPHHGSEWTESPIGKLGRRLIEFPATMQADYMNLIQQNADVWRVTSPKLPTSLDHLAPDDAILQATLQLRTSREASAHSIIGTGHRQPDGSDGDGIVAVSSASIAGVDSEHFVEATHRAIHHADETIAIVRHILLQSHLASSSVPVRDRSSGVRHLDEKLETLKHPSDSGSMSID